ncbi:MAG: gliding motility-associated C-terminal domain-containing protein [Crocinitomicaceae bacterium]|nr:gliding motility-associated C-terminal domain-containing protein [Crocinitomicaceae bacterium]
MKNIFTLVLIFCCGFGYAQETTDDCNGTLKVPSAFSPNGDEKNELWSIPFVCPPELFHITVYDRWGHLVFESRSYTFTWDGNGRTGDAVPDGTYTYAIKYSLDGNKYQSKGTVAVLR